MHQFNQHALPGDREFVIALGVQKADVITRRPFADPPGRKAHAVGSEPFHGAGQVINPQANVVQRGGVHSGFLVHVQRLHDVHLHLHGPFAHGQNVFINVFTLTLEGAGLLQPQHVHPQGFHALLVGAANGDLLDAQNFEGALVGCHSK